MAYPYTGEEFYGWECEACNKQYEYEPKDAFYDPRVDFHMIGGYKICQYCTEEFDEQFKGNDDYITDFIEGKE